MKLNIGYFYPYDLNLYGDRGNIEILASRAAARKINTELFYISSAQTLTSSFMANINLVFMGGGPDSGQKAIFNDLLTEKGPFLRDYIENGGVGLYICGSYQLLGHYYKPAIGDEIPGLGIFDLYTQHFGNHKPRCIGNVAAQINKKLATNPIFQAVNKLDTGLVGFENHGGRTYLRDKSQAFATIQKGHGNNSEDHTEGYHYKNSFGSYFHGPILSKNPHFADYLIAEALHYTELAPLDDALINTAHQIAAKYN